MRILFMGTPDFAVPVIQRLVEVGHQVVAVVTQPDKPAGRGRQPISPPVKQVAERQGLPVLQPTSLRKLDVVQKMRALRPDAIVVAAFGQLLPAEVLQAPPLGCLNVHPSLLPKYRGASPIAAAILAGEQETGVTMMLMDEGWDTGPILAQHRVSISPEDTTQSLGEKLARIGADLLVETLDRWAKREITPRPQDHAIATYIKPFKKEDGRIDWRLSAEELSRRCRAFHPWPGCYSTWKGRTLKFLRVTALIAWQGQATSGDVVAIDHQTAVAAGSGALVLHEVQLEGGKAMGIREFLLGHRDFIGSHLD
ncbi:MAG: methionyl-tRNA formyltransferase [Chloroflexi bacterium]|nr:methionyl-tRNA formyltransferase [Chloroflexota bacterium]